MPFSDWHLHFLLGVAILVPLAARRFASPTWLRSYTSAARYHIALVLYLASQTLLYYLVCAALLNANVPQVPIPADDDAVLPLIASPVVIALALGVVLPALWVVRHLEYLPRRAARRLAEIPAHAYRLAESLERAEFRPPAQIEANVRLALASRGLEDEAQLVLPGARPVARRLLETACLFYQVRDWEGDPRYQRFLGGTRHEFYALDQRFDQLAMRIPRSFRNIERFATSVLRLVRRRAPASGTASAVQDRELGELLTSGVRDLLHEAREEVEAFRSNLCLYVARGVLSSEPWASQRLERLRSMGFGPELGKRHAATILAQCFAIIVACLFVFFAVLGTGSQTQGTLELTARVIMIATIQVLALTVAIVPKSRYGFANPGLSGTPPYAFLLLVGIVAVLCVVPVSVLFRSLIYKDLSYGISQLAHSYPWFLMSWFTATATAWLIQDHRWLAITRNLQRQRILDMVVMATGMMATFLLVRAVLVGIDAPEIPDPAMAGGAFAIGAALGYLVPAEFRTAPARLQRPRAGDAAAAGTAKISPAPHEPGAVSSG